MENEEDTNLDPDDLVFSSTSSNTEFCMVYDDDVIEDDTLERSTSTSRLQCKESEVSDRSKKPSENVDMDVEAIKKKANEIATSLKKFQSSRGKSADTSTTSDDYEPPEEFKRYHETSQLVAQKLKEDRLLFEESQKRSETSRNSKRFHKDTSKPQSEESENLTEINNLKQKVDKLESTVARLQDALDEKDQIISEKEEIIRNLSESVSNEYATRLNLLEQSQEEIKRIKEEHIKAIERVTASKEEFCNQLQIIRQKYLQVENELKLADFARSRLVSKNAQLKEKVDHLENENEELRKTFSQEEKGDNDEKENQAAPFLDINDYIAKHTLHPKIQCVEMIVNEFYAYLIENAMSNSEYADDDCCVEDTDYATQTLEKITDKLESMFYLTKDKFNTVTSLEEDLKLSREKLADLERVNEENKQQETKLKKLLASLKSKVQSESAACKELSDQLAKSKDRVYKLEQELSSKTSPPSDDTEHWKTEYQRLEQINLDITRQLDTTREQAEQLAALKSECARLREENNEISMLLEIKSREHDVLMGECENLRKAQEDCSSSDKTENDFVVLRRRDAECEDNKSEDSLKEKYDKLCEDNDKLMTSIRGMSEKAIEWENEKLTMRDYRDQYEKLSDELKSTRYQLEEVVSQKAKAEKEVDSLNSKLDVLESQLVSNEEFLHQVTLNGDKLKEQLRQAEELNEKLESEVAALRSRNNAASDDQQFQLIIEALEAEKSKLSEECEKFKTKYQRLQVYCKANINKGDKSSDGNAEVEKYRNKCRELLALNKQLQASLNEAQSNRRDDGDTEKLNAQNRTLQVHCDQMKKQLETLQERLDELQSSKQDDLEDMEKLNSENHALQVYCAEAKQQMETLKSENAKLSSLKIAHEDLEASNKRLKEALLEAEQKIANSEELEALRKANEELHQRYVETAQQTDRLSRENSELRERCARTEDERHQQTGYRDQMERQRDENHTLNDRLAEALNRVMSLSEENGDLTARLQQSRSEEITRELEWYRQEYESQKTYCQEISHVLDALRRENAQLKESKVKFDEQFAAMCKEAGQLREMVDQMKTENQALDATNEQLMDFCNKARDKIAALNRNDQEYYAQVEALQSKCADLEASNDHLRRHGSDEMDRLRSENDMLVATNDQLTRFCTDAKCKIDELEKVKQTCDELQSTVNELRETYERELADLKVQVESEETSHGFPNNVLALESELALAKEKIRAYEDQLSRNDATIVDLQSQLTKANVELKRFHDHIEDVQQEATALVHKCTTEVERLNTTIVELSEENDELRKRCVALDHYVAFYDQTCPLMERVRYISEEAFQMVEKLQYKMAADHDTEKSDAGVQCDDNLLDYYVRRKYTELKEERLRLSTLSEISNRLTELEKYADTVARELVEKERIVVHYKTAIEAEREKYENSIDELRRNAATESNHKYERNLAEIQQTQSHDLERYKALMNEERAKYEQIIDEMQQNLHHYKSLVDEERVKYQRIIFEMQENAKQLESARREGPVYGDERIHYENVIFEYRQKLDNCLTLLQESETRNLPKPSTDFGTQVDESDPVAKTEVYEQSKAPRVSELKLFDAFKPAESEQQMSGVKKYYDYYKGVIKKEIKDILQPEDDVVGDWATDAESEIKDEDIPEPSATLTVGNLLDALDRVAKRFSVCSFAQDYKFDETIEEFPLAFKLAEVFQTVVTYYVDSPNSRENPYALELLKKFRDVAKQIDDPDEPVRSIVAADQVEERFDELLVTAQRYERENKYLHEAVSFFETLLTEYSSFDSELRLAELLNRWRENVVFDTAIPYYEFPVTIEEARMFPHKCMDEFNEAFDRWKAGNVKRIEIVGVRSEIRDSDRPAEAILLDVYKILETVKTKMHDLICDLHYVYNAENRQVNPVEFFEQIEDVNHWIEHSLKTILNDESIRQDVSNIMADSEAEPHSHDDYDESQSDGTSDEKHSHSHAHPDHGHERDTVAELKSMLGASNKKIDSLVKELTEVKGSRDYNEFKQLHSKLDETMYQLHLRDVHCVELTQELTQLLSERDSLQLKLSTILRQNEQLREASQATSTYEGVDQQPSNLENKLKDLQQVNYMKDPLISEASRLHHASQMQLFSDDGADSQRNKDSGGFSVPSLFKWITGDTENK